MKTALLRFRLLTGIALAVLALAIIPLRVTAEAPDKSSPSSQFVTAYNSMTMADWLKEKGMQAEAADLYTEALDLFNKLAADYPQWQSAVVSFRITYCREALGSVERPPATPRVALPARRTSSSDVGGRAGKALSGEREATTDNGLSRRSSDPIGTKTEGQTTNDGLPTEALAKVGRQMPEDGRRTAEDSLKRTPGDGQQTARDAGQATDLSRVARDDGKSAIRNPQSAILNLSPLTFKLQQAALSERGWDYTGALSMYIALLEEFPQEPWALKGACRCCLRLGLMDRARALIRLALALPSPDADMNLLAALVDCYDGRYQEAITLLRQSLKQNGASPEAHAALGVALASGGQMEEAQKEMKRALSFNPKLGDAYYNLARLSLRQKPTDRDTARVHYQNALRHGAAPDPELDALLAE